MSIHRLVPIFVALAATALLVRPAPVSAETPATPGSAQGSAARDGQHDFDFLNGHWKAHLKKLLHPLTGSTTWVEYEGTAYAHPIMGGPAQLDQFDLENPVTHERRRAMTLRLYNPETQVWSLYYVDGKNGILGLPPQIGRFDNNKRGEFYASQVFQGDPILVRFLWTDITPTSARFEQAFSPDGGKTWETNWIYTCTRVES